MSPRLGQKIKDNPKDTMVRVRMDRETIEKLDYLAEKQSMSRSDVIRNGIAMQYERMQK